MSAFIYVQSISIIISCGYLCYECGFKESDPSHIVLHCSDYHIYLPQAAGNIGKMGISAAMKVGNIVKTKIEEEIHKHQHPEEGEGDGRGASEGSSDAVGGEDVQEEEDDAKDEPSTPGRGEGYLSNASSPASPR